MRVESAEVPINATAKPSPIRQAQRQGQGPRLGQPQLPAPQPRGPWLGWVWEGHRVSPHARRSLCLPPSQSLGWATLTAKPLLFGQRQRQQPLALRNASWNRATSIVGFTRNTTPTKLRWGDFKDLHFVVYV